MSSIPAGFIDTVLYSRVDVEKGPALYGVMHGPALAADYLWDECVLLCTYFT